MSNKYYEKNNYEEFYNDWTDCDNKCKKHHKKDRCEDKCNDKCNDDCFMEIPNDYGTANANFEGRALRRCDEDAIEREIERLFRFILNELCNVEDNIDVISRAFVRLANLLVNDTCLEPSERNLICCVAQDLKALQVLIDKTIRDTKCLKKDVKN